MTDRQKTLGREGEKAVRALLEERGYRILETNFRTRYGEIDIIAAVERTLVFVEVKTRTSTNCGIAEEAVNFRKQQRIRKLAVQYLTKPGHERYQDLRFDVAAVSAGTDGEIEEIKIYEGAF
jgi:putative endonuclease